MNRARNFIVKEVTQYLMTVFVGVLILLLVSHMAMPGFTTFLETVLVGLLIVVFRWMAIDEHDKLKQDQDSH